MAAAKYTGPRLARVTTQNDFLRYRSVVNFSPPGVAANSPYVVTANAANNMNSLQGFEVKLTPAMCVGLESGFLAECYSAYDEFRIRSVHVRMLPNFCPPATETRSSVDIFWIPNHQIFDADDGGVPFDNYQELCQSARVSHVQTRLDREFGFSFIPQVPLMEQLTYVGGAAAELVYHDVAMPWLRTSDENKNYNFRGPWVSFRRPIGDSAVVVAEFDVLVEAVFEFRNLNRTAQ